MIGARRVLHAATGLVCGSAVLTVLAVLVLAAAPALAARGHVFVGSFGSLGPGQLGEPVDVAVNEATGDVYVVDKANNRVEIFNSTGSKFEGEFNGSGLGLGILGSGQLLNEGKAAGSGGLPEEVSTGRFDEPEGIAVDNDPSSPSHGDVYVVDTNGHAEGPEAPAVVDKFSASGEYIGQITRNPDGEPQESWGEYEFADDEFRTVSGIAVDANGEVWVEENNFIKRKGSNPGANFGAAAYSNATPNMWVGFSEMYIIGASGLAVDSEDNLYVHNTFYAYPIGKTNENSISEFSASGEPVNPEVDGEAPTGVAVEHSSNDVYVSHLTKIHRLDANGKSLETLTIPGGHGSGVAIDSTTLTVYVADSVAGVVDMYGPEAAGAPTVSAGSESVRDVTATSASFSAEVNPRSEPDEEATSYSFEYGPCDTPTTCASSPYIDGTPVPEGRLAPNYEPDLLSAHPQDLVAHSTYHMRLVAHNSHPGAAEGEELIFTTQAAGPFGLPDGRQWELVSPSNKHGALIQASGSLSEAAMNGDAITYYANAPIESRAPGNSNSIVQALAGRASGGWVSRNIDAPHETAPGAGPPTEYPFFSTDLSLGLLRPTGAFVPSVSPDASEQTPFLRSDFPPGDPGDLCTMSCYTPLVTGAPGFENVPAGTVFGGTQESGAECTHNLCGPEFVGASPDLKHVVLGYNWAPLVEDAPTGSLYEWTDGRLSVISVLPNEQPAVGNAALGTGGGVQNIARNAVSLDGSRVVWSSGSRLYLRDSLKEKTVWLDEVQGGAGTGSIGGASFQTAASDGSRVFFTDSQRLTADATGSSDLYECEIVEEAGALRCRLTDLTGGGGEPANVMGIIPGVSEDGSYVYFVADRALTGVQANERGETAVAGQPNLYVKHAGVTRLIATLSGEDSTDWAAGGSIMGLTARVSPDGRWFSFMSNRSLTGYDNRDAVSGKRDKEVFLYRADENREGELVCASCNPTGASPDGVEYNSSVELGPGAFGFGTGSGLAAILPGWTSPFYQSRYLSNSGRLFFDSFDALVPQDTNSAEDAYQYEPSGVGGCSEANATFVIASDGCVGLISSGTSKEGSAFLDASQTGGDVFFLTAAQLSRADIDSVLDIYDAHECGTGEDCSPQLSAPVPACEGDACQSPVTPPEDQTPGSLTYQGPGNPPAPVLSSKAKSKSKPVKCRKSTVKRQGKCAKRKTKKRAKKAKRAIRRGK